jgi:outer membrane protein
MPALSRHGHATAAAAAAMLIAGSAQAEEAGTAPAPASPAQRIAQPVCAAGSCTYSLSSVQLLGLAEQLVRDGKYDEARPLVAALKAAPGMALPHSFLEGLIAMGSGDAATATARFRTILKDHPDQTRVRLELAKALMMQGNLAAADYHLRLSLGDEDLPEDISRMIGNARSVIRSKRKFRFGFDVGFAPDSNINSATAAETVDINFGPNRVPVSLDDNARARSGLGATASFYAGMRLPAGGAFSLVTDLDADSVTYEDSAYSDYSVQIAAGPELALSDRSELRFQAVGLYRWYGGEVAARQYGGKLTFQHEFAGSRRVALQLDGRRSESELNTGYTGWQMGANATFEQVVGRSAIVSFSAVARRDAMRSDFYSSRTLGLNAGIGGELPWGINAGISGGVTWSGYDDPQLVFSTEKRTDWRYQARAHAGLRQFRLAGFSPSVEYQFMKVDSNYDLYNSDRHRFQFKLARYF